MRYNVSLSVLCLMIVSAEGIRAATTELTPEQKVEILNEAGRAFDRGADVRLSNSNEAIEAFVLARPREAG